MMWPANWPDGDGAGQLTAHGPSLQAAHTLAQIYAPDLSSYIIRYDSIHTSLFIHDIGWTQTKYLNRNSRDI